jgi:hypothetical protein
MMARTLVAASAALVLVACGNSARDTNAPETNPPGDIPDSQAFVPFTTSDGVATVTVPEGWTQSVDGGATVFADKLLSVRIETTAAAEAPSVESVTATDVPRLRSTVSHYQAGKINADLRKAGPVVVVTYGAASAPDPVTGKTVAQAVERYLFWHNGHELVLTLSAPTGTDTVDAWRAITDSVSWP